MNNYSALMYNIQNLYGSIAGINNKIFDLENQILQQKSPPPQTDMESKIAQLISTVDALKTKHALFETQLDELKSAINSKQDIASISLARELTEKHDIASISLAHEVTEVAPQADVAVEPPQATDDVFELVPPKPKGGRKKKA
jgi:peptidoglycan hydrolase CwlO-like protein